MTSKRNHLPADCAIALVGAICLAAASAHAFVPDPSYALGKWLDQIEKVQTLRIVQRTTIIDRGLSGGSAVIEEEIRIKRPSYFRKTSVYPRARVDDFITPQRAVRFIGDKAETASPVKLLGPVGTFFVYSQRKALLAALKQAEVETSASRLQLQQGMVTMEIGLEAANRVYLSKDNWVPVAAGLGGRMFRFDTAALSRFPVPYPDKIEVFEKDVLVERIDVVSVEVNPPLSPNVFEPSLLTKPPTKPKS